MDYSLPGSSVHGILQAWILQWVAMPSSGESSWPRDQNHVGALPLAPPEKPWFKPRWAEFQSSKTYSYCKTLTGYIMSTSTARRSGKRSCFYGVKGSPAVGLFRNFVRNTQYVYTSCRADILPASLQNLSLVLTVDSDVMMEWEDRKGYVDSQHHHGAEGQQSNMCTSHPELKGLLALMFCVLIKEAAVNGCSLPCQLATRYLNTYNQGGGGVLLISGISACHSRFFYSSKRNVVFCFFFSWRIQGRKPVCSNDLTDGFWCLNLKNKGTDLPQPLYFIYTAQNKSR